MEPPPQGQNIRVGTLNRLTVDSLFAVYGPTPQEVSSMISALCARKKWTRAYFGSLMRISETDMRGYEQCSKQVTGPIQRLIWTYYMLDLAPEIVFSTVTMASWGKTKKQLPAPHVRLTKERKATIIAELAAMKAPRWEQRLTYKQLIAKYESDHLNQVALRNLCKMAGYKPPDGRSRGHRWSRTPLVLRPESIWMHVDWRKSDKEIAEKLHVYKQTVFNRRYYFRRLYPPRLKQHLLACGADPANFEPIFKDPVKRYKAKNKRPRKEALREREDRELQMMNNILENNIDAVPPLTETPQA